jgi:hypothetical protein
MNFLVEQGPLFSKRLPGLAGYGTEMNAMPLALLFGHTLYLNYSI